jgi:tetrahydromethanopterin S-methyltransferase subunit G
VVSDEELEEHVSRVEYAKLFEAEPKPGLVERLEDIEASSEYIHGQFARRGAVVGRQPAEEERTLAERLAAVERRLAEVEAVLREEAAVDGESG